VANSIASNRVCPCYLFGYKGITQNQIFSFGHMIFFPAFQHSFKLYWKLTITHSSKYLPSLHSSPHNIFSISEYSVKIFLTVILFVIGITLKEDILIQHLLKDVFDHHQYRLKRTKNSTFYQFQSISISNK